MKNEVNRAPWAKKKTFLFILALCAASVAWGTTVTKTAKQIANGKWTSGKPYVSATLDDVITITVTPGDGTNKNGTYYTGDYTDTHDWRMYQARANGQFTIKAAQGYVITSVTLTYEVTNTGVVSTAVKETGVATPAANQILSETAYPFANSEITFYVGNTTAATTNGQARIRSFSVTYEKGIVEDFKNPDGTDWNFATDATSVEGKYYTWALASCRYDKSNTNDPTKSHGQGVGMWKKNSSSFVTTAEGGVKAIAFYWNQMSANESNKTDKLAVWLNGTAQSNQAITGTTTDKRGEDVLCILTPTTGSAPTSWPKDNCELKLTPGGHTEARVTFGPITIVPYLRYTYTETEQVNDDESTFDCSLQIDNTDDEGTITYISDNTDAVSFADPANPEATIVGGGEATITATWSEGASTSFKLKVNVLPTPAVTFPGITDGKKSVALDVESFTEAATVDMTVPVVYSSSNTNVATVDNNGKVTVLTTGTTDITAKVEAKKGEYKEASATYTLTVTASKASELSFVEKFSGVSRCNTAKDDCGYIEAENFIGTDGLFHWTVNSVRLRKGDVIGKGGLRFSTSLEKGSYHLLPDPNYNDGIMEGGIKRIAFTYKKASGGSGANLEISAGEVLRYVKSNSETETQFAANFFVKENTSLKMFNTKGASVVTIGPISIVPYLLFTTKSDEAFLSLVDEYDIKNVLINNTDDGEVVYSILTADHQSQISNDGVVTFTNVTESETITIQAAWTPAGEPSATVTTTMTLYVDVESKTDNTVDEKFSKYDTEGWTNNEGSEVIKNGDVYDWRTKSTRHKTTDKLVDNEQQAIWFNTEGYVATADAEDNTKIGPAEGGIKRIAFDWNQNGNNQTGDDLYISVSVDGTEMSAIRRDGGAQPTEPWQYIHNLNVKKNATLKIENKSTASKTDGGRVKIGTIVITPYLLYTTKEVSKMISDESYINPGLINNINKDLDGGTITFTSSDETVATIAIGDETHKDKVVFVAAGDVTIYANWTPDNADEPAITTSYLLHITEKADRGLSFQYAVKETTVGGSAVTNMLNGTLDATEQTWSTASDGAITSVDNVGLVSPFAIGTDTVTVVVKESEAYQEGTASYKVIVRTGVADDDKLVESFSGITKDAPTSETEWKGDLQNYFSWKVKSTRHNGTAGDTIGGAGVAGTVLFAQGQIATDGVIEGGIKYFTFNWKQPYVEPGATLRLTLEAGEEFYQQDYIVATDNGGTTHEHLYFAGNMQVKKNVQLILKNESFKTDGGAALTENGRIAIDKFEIVPYLFYTTKSHTIENATEGATYTNADLINNIDNNEGTIAYSLISEGADDIASINASTGEVTVMTGGVVTVQAKWEPEGAEEDEFVTTTYELTINFPQPTITFNDIEVALDGTVTPNITVKLDEEDITETATITYEVADKNIATWDATNGWKLKTHGTTQVTAKVERTAQYGATSATATMTVNTMTFAEGTFFTENFGGEKTNDYSTKTEDWRGKDNVYPWTYLNWIRYENRVRIKMSESTNGYIYMNPFDGGALEGGIKAVQVTWSAPGAEEYATDFYVDDMKNSDATKVTVQKEADGSTAKQITQAIFNSKTNKAQLRIRIGSSNKSAIDVYSVDIVPYLLYTKKEVPVTYELEGTNMVDATANLINNIDEGTVTYSLSTGAQATIDGSTITLKNVTEDITVTATWGEVSTTYTLKVTAKTPDFTLENKTAGAFATICLPKKIDHVENATLWSISHGDMAAIEFEEADIANDDPGMPYLVQVAANGDVNFYYGEGEAVTEPVPANVANGFVGSLSEGDIEIPNNGTAILISGGRLRIAGAYCVLTQNHAYITTEYLPASAPVGGAPRRTIRLYNPDAAPTNLNGLNGIVKPMKVLRDGQFYIIRDTKTYNAQGIEVQ